MARWKLFIGVLKRAAGMAAWRMGGAAWQGAEGQRVRSLVLAAVFIMDGA